MKLKLEHLAPYFPYGLKAEMLDYQSDYVCRKYDEIIGIHQWSKNKDWCLLTDGGSKPSLDAIKPILRPLSDLTKEIEHNGEKFVHSDRLAIHLFSKGTREIILKGEINGIPYWVIQKLFEWHFDVFGLIEQNLAIDINTLNK